MPVLAQKNGAAEVDGSGRLRSSSGSSHKPASKSGRSVRGQLQKIAIDEIALDGEQAATREAYQDTGRRHKTGKDDQDFDVLQDGPETAQLILSITQVSPVRKGKGGAHDLSEALITEMDTDRGLPNQTTAHRSDGRSDRTKSVAKETDGGAPEELDSPQTWFQR